MTHCPHCGAQDKHAREIYEHKCPCCGTTFKTTRTDKVYCSKRCMKTAQMRRYRQRYQSEEQ